MQATFEDLRRWIGKTVAAEDHVTATPACALAATLDREIAFNAGDPLPPPWHWLYFLTMEPLSDAGPDGHPKRGGFLPPVPLPRRMWAGSRMTFLRPLRVGDAIRRESRIADVNVKEGRSGTLVFVTVRHEITRNAESLLVDEHDIVYRDLQKADTNAPVPRMAPNDHAWIREIHPTPVLLFRYSALTFNSHRIHYDFPYVTGVEGYPGLDRQESGRAVSARRGVHRSGSRESDALSRVRAVRQCAIQCLRSSRGRRRQYRAMGEG
ncbi:MAG: acyl-CoA dehydrogenase [Betaproteobacteria bacterium]|nr:MAG: acyl-CoA dehydrogenase [Betaproteobacteria bacterium]